MHKDWPRWFAKIDFSELKLKLMASIVAITAIKLLEGYMNVGSVSDRDLAWQTGVHLAFVVSALLLALAERVRRRPRATSGSADALFLQHDLTGIPAAVATASAAAWACRARDAALRR